MSYLRWPNANLAKRFLLVLGQAFLLLLGGLFIATLVYADGPVGLEPGPTWISAEQDETSGLAWGDVDGDGDLDLAVGDQYGPAKLYLNGGGILATTAVWSSSGWG